MIHYLSVGDVLAIAEEIGAGGELRDMGLLTSAVGRPQSAMFGVEAYTDIWEKAAAFMHSLIANHPFIDGNKRTGLVATLAFLDRNGIATEPLDEDLAYELTIGIASSKIVEVAEIAAGLKGSIGSEG